MRKQFFKLLIALNLLIFSEFCYSQLNNERHLGILIGNGYEDGWVKLTKLPTIGILYNHKISRYFAIRVGITSFYRTMPDSYLYDDANGNLVANLIVRDSRSPFITDSDRDRITRVGIKDLNSSFTLKMLSVPIDFGIMFYPIRYRNHRIGAFVGGSLSFESQNFWRDYYPGDITLKDGTKYKSSFLALNTEFRSLTPGECLKLEYMYYFKRFQVALTASENNVLISHAGSINFYNVSIGLHAKI
jgi:hypothetical protein